MIPKNFSLHVLIWFLVTVSFVVSAFFLILFASGLRLNFKAKTIQRTGLITVNSEPKGAYLFVNNKFKGKTPVKLTYLYPRTYNLKIKMVGYKDWERSVSLKPGEYVNLKAILFLENPQIEVIDKEKWFKEVGNLKSSTEKKSYEALEKEIKNCPNQDVVEVDINYSKKVALLRSEYEIWLCNFKDVDKPESKIIARFSKPIKKMVFYPDFEHLLYIMDNKLNVMEISATNNIELFSLEDPDFFITPSGKEIFFKKEENYFIAKIR